MKRSREPTPVLDQVYPRLRMPTRPDRLEILIERIDQSVIDGLGQNDVAASDPLENGFVFRCGYLAHRQLPISDGSCMYQIRPQPTERTSIPRHEDWVAIWIHR